MKKLDSERVAFCSNPEPKRYERNVDVIEHLEKIALSKYKLYNSDLKKSGNSFYKRSNFSIPFSIRSCRSNNAPLLDFNKKRFL